MAWVRTSTSLISFGFTIYKFFQYLQDQQRTPQEGLLGPRQYATLMIAIGIIALILATVQHRRDMKELRKHHPEVPYSMATVLAGLISLLGVVALLAVIFRQ
jgi:putative membrane protein